LSNDAIESSIAKNISNGYVCERVKKSSDLFGLEALCE
jgi:hypothetical protein